MPFLSSLDNLLKMHIIFQIDVDNFWLGVQYPLNNTDTTSCRIQKIIKTIKTNHYDITDFVSIKCLTRYARRIPFGCDGGDHWISTVVVVATPDNKAEGMGGTSIEKI